MTVSEILDRITEIDKAMRDSSDAMEDSKGDCTIPCRSFFILRSAAFDYVQYLKRLEVKQRK